jgi:hypothetical protein
MALVEFQAGYHEQGLPLTLSWEMLLLHRFRPQIQGHGYLK